MPAVLCFALFAVCGHAASQTVVENVKEDTVRVDSVEVGDSTERHSPKTKVRKAKNWLKRFFRNFDDYDTDYISPNYYNYTAMLQNTNFYQVYRMKGTDADGHTQTLQMAPSPSFKVGPYFGWRWIFLGYTFDVSHPGSAGATTEFSLSLYSSMLGCDLVYIRNTGDFTLRKVTGFSDEVTRSVQGSQFSGMDSYTAAVNVYYVFNHRHFSYPAAYAQSTVQRKSCGSWMLGLSYSKQRVEFDYTRLPQQLLSSGTGETSSGNTLIDELKISHVEYQSYNLSGGYAYNWVFARNCLFSLSLTPALGFKQAGGERLSGESIWLNVKNLKFDFISRAGIVWNNSHFFAGASLITHLYDYQKDSYSMSNYVNYLNIYVGFNFHRKSQYRHRSR